MVFLHSEGLAASAKATVDARAAALKSGAIEVRAVVEDLQISFLRILLATPASTPRAALVWDCGAIKMKFRIMQNKLVFLHYIMQQSETSLARQILYEQHEQNYPGLVQECRKFVKDLGILNPLEFELSDQEWKRMVKEAIRKAKEKELKAEIISKYKKL